MNKCAGLDHGLNVQTIVTDFEDGVLQAVVLSLVMTSTARVVSTIIHLA